MERNVDGIDIFAKTWYIIYKNKEQKGIKNDYR